MTASSTLRAVLGLNFPAKNPVSKRLNQGSRRMVLFPNVISQPSVPNQVILTPAVPEPPLAGGVSAPSATPGSSNDLLQSTVAAATPAARPLPRNRRRDTRDCHDVQSESTKHINASSTQSRASLEIDRRRVKMRGSHGPPSRVLRCGPDSKRPVYARAKYVETGRETNLRRRHHSFSQPADPPSEGRRGIRRIALLLMSRQVWILPVTGLK